MSWPQINRERQAINPVDTIREDLDFSRRLRWTTQVSWAR